MVFSKASPQAARKHPTIGFTRRELLIDTAPAAATFAAVVPAVAVASTTVAFCKKESRLL